MVEAADVLRARLPKTTEAVVVHRTRLRVEGSGEGWPEQLFSSVSPLGSGQRGGTAEAAEALRAHLWVVDVDGRTVEAQMFFGLASRGRPKQQMLIGLASG